MKIKEEKFTTVPTLCGCLSLKSPFFATTERKSTPKFYSVSCLLQTIHPITVHSNTLCSFLACKHRPEYSVVCPIYLMPWLKGAPIFKVERNALLCFSPSSLETLAGKLQTELFLPVCLQTMVMLNLDREDRK